LTKMLRRWPLPLPTWSASLARLKRPEKTLKRNYPALKKSRSCAIDRLQLSVRSGRPEGRKMAGSRNAFRTPAALARGPVAS
jgi:hypothetical protein